MRFLKKLSALILFGIVLHAFPAHAAYNVPVTISSGASLSSAADLTPYATSGPTMVAIEMPSAWTAASITLQASSDGCQTFYNVFIQAGTEYTVTSPAASEYIVLSPNDLIGMNCIKIWSGTSGSPVNQGAARILNVVVTGVVR